MQCTYALSRACCARFLLAPLLQYLDVIDARKARRLLRRYHNHAKSNSSSLYVHWPYCEKRCTYCNFNKYVSQNVDHTGMMECLIREFTTIVELAGISQVTSVFFGGGTPSLMRPADIERLLGVVSSLSPDPGLEVTLECNPTPAARQTLRDFKRAGVSRVSVGIQCLQDEELSRLGRTHTSEDALRCVEEAECLFPGRVSVDVLYGRPGQDLQQWLRELELVLTLDTAHVSLYELTLERGTRLFKDVQAGSQSMPCRETVSQMYLAAVEALKSRGLLRYEASNFAREGHECRHNIGYWKGDQYLGIGPGSHSRLDVNGRREARIQTLEPGPWLHEVKSRGHGTRLVRALTTLQRLEEMLVMGLRTSRGITNEDWFVVSQGTSLKDTFEGSSQTQRLLDAGLILLDTSALRPTEEGLNVADSLSCALLPLLAEMESATAV
ncbi:radical S-adenosyl methionine domain-containing protein 1, mitochondrial [Ixodes scapularis]|uniref:radical S-adenosyl methionine domain-containing protein 1, mitochondrial n=1 Tax=Ixodes scapularis TaxID=6945 RepID=UPI001A9E4993|nr:radical S-adenosyl methionine domain-containing protein 1, mitochondrial [Ixodes scapularis]